MTVRPRPTGVSVVRTDAAALGGPLSVSAASMPPSQSDAARDGYELATSAVRSVAGGSPERYAYLEAELRVRSGAGTGYSVEAGLGAGDRRTGLRYTARPDGEERLALRFEYDFGVSRNRSDPASRERNSLEALGARLEAIDAREQAGLRAAEDAVSAVTAAAIALDNARPGPIDDAQWSALRAVAEGSEVLRGVAASPGLSAALGFETPAELVDALRARAGGDNALR